jgi:hypothetical protein
MRAKRHGANGNRGETTRGEWDSGRNDPVPKILTMGGHFNLT